MSYQLAWPSRLITIRANGREWKFRSDAITHEGCITAARRHVSNPEIALDLNDCEVTIGPWVRGEK